MLVVVDEDLLIPRDDIDPGWEWGCARVANLGATEQLDDLKLNRVSELILANVDGDRSTLAVLWARFGECLNSELLNPHLDGEVVSCVVEVLSDSELSYRRYQRTESLDLEVLSDAARRERVA